jgi:hypothetical protein
MCGGMAAQRDPGAAIGQPAQQATGVGREKLAPELAPDSVK